MVSVPGMFHLVSKKVLREETGNMDSLSKVNALTAGLPCSDLT